jgi:hypothetical protein
MNRSGKCLDLFIFVDALGWRIAQRHDFLSDLLPLRNRCDTVFGYSSTCDPTILTGLNPVEHGHFSCFVKADEEHGEKPFANLASLGWLPEKIAGHHRLRGKLSQWLGKKLGYTGYFQLYSVPFRHLAHLDYTEKRDIYEPGGILGGQETIFEHWKRSGRPWMRSDWRRSDSDNLDEIDAAVSKGEVELAYLFTSGLDALMHRVGTRDDKVGEWLHTFAKRLHGIYQEAANRYSEVRFHLFSDHGMTDTVNGSDMLRRWEKLGHRFGEDYVAVWDSTMVRFWFNGNETLASETRQWLDQQPEGHTVSDDQLETWGCLFPDRRYGDLFYLLEPGTLFTPSFMNQGWVTAMHGFDPDHQDSPGCWLSNSDTNEAHAVTRLQEIFPVMKAAAENRGTACPHPVQATLSA